MKEGQGLCAGDPVCRACVQWPLNGSQPGDPRSGALWGDGFWTSCGHFRGRLKLFNWTMKGNGDCETLEMFPGYRRKILSICVWLGVVGVKERGKENSIPPCEGFNQEEEPVWVGKRERGCRPWGERWQWGSAESTQQTLSPATWDFKDLSKLQIKV